MFEEADVPAQVSVIGGRLIYREGLHEDDTKPTALVESSLLTGS